MTIRHPRLAQSRARVKEPQQVEQRESKVATPVLMKDDVQKAVLSARQPIATSSIISDNMTISQPSRIKINQKANNLHDNKNSLPGGGALIFVIVSFIVLMLITIAWLLSYYIQRFRQLRMTTRVYRRRQQLAKRAISRIPTKILEPLDSGSEAGDGTDHISSKQFNYNDTSCAICIEPHVAGDNVRILPCKHIFHKKCIDPWLYERQTCPICKLDILKAVGFHHKFVADGSPDMDRRHIIPITEIGTIQETQLLTASPSHDTTSLGHVIRCATAGSLDSCLSTLQPNAEDVLLPVSASQSMTNTSQNDDSSTFDEISEYSINSVLEDAGNTQSSSSVTPVSCDYNNNPIRR